MAAGGTASIAATPAAPVAIATARNRSSYSVSNRHPVFFTERLRRSPGAKDGAQNNPVALGYGDRAEGAKL